MVRLLGVTIFRVNTVRSLCGYSLSQHVRPPKNNLRFHSLLSHREALFEQYFFRWTAVQGDPMSSLGVHVVV